MKYQVLAELSQENPYPQSPYQFSDYTDVLTIYNQDRIPQEFALSADRITIGRVDSNDITLNDKAISRHHAVLERSDDGWWITDLGSTNGVLFGKTRIAANQAVRWSPDSKAHLGPFQLRWQRHLQDETDDRTQIHLPKELNSEGTLVKDSADFVEIKVPTDRRTID
ncbi:MAG TPA: FHA domain-containing protein, partial [Anaerolineae bacterium]|nr:FHA domain-containing protein [Anaerolineae bacterium]